MPAFGASLGTAVGTTPGSTWTLTTTGAVPAGGTVVVALGWFNASATYTVSGGGLTWTMPAAKTDGSSRNVAHAFAPAPAGLASGTVLTFTVASGSFSNGAAACYVTGADTLDVNGTGGSGSTVGWSGSITTSDPNTIVFGFAFNDGLASGSETPGSGYSEWCDFVNGADVNVFAGVYQVVSSAGAYTPGGTWSSGTNPWVVATLSLKSGGGGGGGGSATTVTPTRRYYAPRRNPALEDRFGPFKPLLQGTPPPPPPPSVPDPPYFTTIGGSTPQFVVSNEDWGLLSNAARNPNPASGGTYQTTFDNYFAARAAQGYNAIEVSIFHIIDYDGAQNGPDGDNVYPFTGSSLDPSGTRNTAWWDRRDYFFSSAASHGFRVFCNISTAYLSAGAFTASWTSAQWTAWGNHLAAKYPNSTHPHVFWIVGDDYFGEKDTELQALYNALNSGGATQPKGMQWYQEASSRKDIYSGSALGTSSWSTAPDYNWGYSYNVWYDVVEKMGIENSTLTPIPYVAGDGYFLQSSATGLTDKQLMRRMVWWAISAGAKGINIGNNIVYHWGSDAYAEVTSNTFYTTTVPAIVGVVNSLPNWHLLLADTSSQLVTAGRGTHASALVSGGSGGQYLSDTDAYVSASWIQSGVNAGTLAVIYFTHAATITIDESKMAAGYTAKWVDPASGATMSTTTGPTYTTVGKSANSDGQNDWVLVLQKTTGTTPVSTTRATTWRVLSAISATRATTWNTKAVVTATRATTWRVLSQVVAATRSTTWRVLSAVSAATRSTTWRVLASVTGTRATTWNTKATITATRATTWRVLAAVAAATRSTTWRVLAKVTATRSTTWNVASSLASVVRNVSTTWRTLASTTATRATTWNTKAAISTTRSTTWRTLAQVAAATRSTTWRVLAQVSAATRSTTWRVLAKITATRSTTWNVASSLTSVVRNVSTTWRTKATTTATRSTTWNTKATVTSTRATTWDVLRAVTPRTVSTTWRALTTVTATRVTSWRTKARVIATRVTSWNVVSLIIPPNVILRVRERWASLTGRERSSSMSTRERED